MLTRKEHQILEFCGWYSSVTALFPFSWNRSTSANQLSEVKSVWGRVIGYFNIAASGLHSGYLIVRFLPGFGYTKEDWRIFPYPIMLHVLMMLAFTVTFIMQVQAAPRVKDLTYILNQLLCFNRLNGKKRLAIEFAPRTRLDRYLIWCPVCFLVMCTPFTALSIVNPSHKHNVFSIVPGQWQNGWVLAICVGIESWHMLKASSMLWFTFFIEYAYVKTSMFWMQKLRSDWPLAKTDFKLSSVKMYRSLSILTALYNNGFCSTLFPTMKTTMEIATIFFLYGILRFHHTAELWVYMMFVFFAPTFIALLVGGISFMTLVNELSLNLLHEFKFTSVQNPRAGAGGERVLRKMVDSCQPICCTIAGLFFMEKRTKIIYMSMLFQSFISILVAVA